MNLDILILEILNLEILNLDFQGFKISRFQDFKTFNISIFSRFQKLERPMFFHAIGNLVDLRAPLAHEDEPYIFARQCGCTELFEAPIRSPELPFVVIRHLVAGGDFI